MDGAPTCHRVATQGYKIMEPPPPLLQPLTKSLTV